ncbi:translationally-controlled tumor protein [Kitasatospora sp. NBC_00315]|uniref:translationally-controlled tumor protein n=1 Tax=Kitasatospora sp. NBC_00315 TaxID=2975963 RepID=UPI003249B6C6
MKVYKDVFNGDDLLSDSFPIKEDGVCYVVEGKHVTRSAIGTADFGGVDEGEDAGEAESDTVTVLNVVDAHGLVETMYDKKSYLNHIKAYLKRVAASLPADKRASWDQQAQEWAKTVLADLDSYRFFTGASTDPEAMTVLMKTGEDGKTPFLYYFRQGLQAEVR